MTRWPILLGAGLAAFVVFALVSIPARAVFDAARPAGVEAGLVTGTVWDARARRVDLGALEISELSARLRASGLLAGEARFDVVAGGPMLRGAGLAGAGFSGAFLQDFDATIGLDAFPELAAAGLPRGETARVRIDRLGVDAQGRCTEASGDVTTAALSAAGARFDTALPLLTATMACRSGTIVLDLEGTNETMSLSGELRLEAAGPDYRIEARTTDREVIGALSLLGFDQEGEAFVADSARQGGA